MRRASEADTGGGKFYSLTLVRPRVLCHTLLGWPFGAAILATRQKIATYFFFEQKTSSIGFQLKVKPNSDKTRQSRENQRIKDVQATTDH
ncbi:hypothetical protein M514_22570 [Trichuris suis]|uniref:Uncharacterized protein n=1 Tax=Trichuris suis TaxID=68888 RepID=A0A085N746_9BILA|nr:hypothetical protein M514_22570 [Trichuris suis]